MMLKTDLQKIVSRIANSVDHPVRLRQRPLRNCQDDPFGGFEIDDELKFLPFYTGPNAKLLRGLIIIKDDAGASS
jgi:hypothetical protein